MKAAVMYGVDQPLVVEEIDVDEPRRNEVLVRTSATGVCTPPSPLPLSPPPLLTLGFEEVTEQTRKAMR